MSLISKILTENKVQFLVTVTFCFLVSFASFAQSDRERQLNDLHRNSDIYSSYESPESNYDTRVENAVRSNSSVQAKDDAILKSSSQNKRDNPIYRHGGEKDIKKENMSTLSFNLFLYIVDKFKED